MHATLLTSSGRTRSLLRCSGYGPFPSRFSCTSRPNPRGGLFAAAAWMKPRRLFDDWVSPMAAVLSSGLPRLHVLSSLKSKRPPARRTLTASREPTCAALCTSTHRIG